MIQRAEHNDNFTRLTNDLIRDMRLSPEAFRLLIFMLSCSDEWNFSVSGLAHLLGWSDRKTKQYVSELKKLGYIEQVTQTDKKGRFMPNVWIVHEEPITAGHKNRTTDKPQGGETARRSNRTTVQPHDGNLAPIRTINIKELSNSKNYQGEEERSARGEFQNVFLSQYEFDDLVHRFGEAKVEKYIEDLGDYLKTHPKKKYASHKRTIMNWIERDEKKAAPIPNNENPFTRLREEEGLL